MTTLGIAGSSTIPFAVAVSGTTAVYVAGKTGGNLDGNTKSGFLNGFVVSHDSSNGTKLHSVLLGAPNAGIHYTLLESLAIDQSSGDVYTAGVTDDTIGTDPKYGATDMVLVKFSGTLTLSYKKQFGSGSAANGSSVVDVNGMTLTTGGDLYVTGRTGTAFSGQTQTGTYDLFSMKLATAGTQTWVRQIGAASATATAGGIAFDGSGNVFAAATADGGFDGNSVIGTSDAVLVKWDGTGAKQ